MAQKSKKEAFERKDKKPQYEVADCKEKIPDTTGTAINIRARKPPEEETRESIEQLRMERDFFQNAISAVSHPFYAIDANNHKILMANQAAINFFGDLSEHPFCYSWTHGRTTPCSGKEHPCPLEIIKKTKQPMIVEHTHYDKEGRPLFFEIHAYPLVDAEGNVSKIIEYSLEITRLKIMEEAHRESEQRYREIIENANDLIQSTLPNGSLVFVNRAWHEILGYTHEDLLSKNVFDIIHPDSLKHYQESFAKVMAGQNETAIQTTFVAKDGKKIFVEGNVSPRILDGKVLSTHGIFRDVTKRKQAEEKLAKYSKHLEEIIAALNFAKEVQQSLLPRHPIRDKNFEIVGSSRYCDETGGDYYDYFELPKLGANVYAIAVGDVSGHGISSALLMATVRAYLRGRVTHTGSVAEIITDVNRLVSSDTAETSQFMTLFFLVIDAQTGRLTWVRAGHDPVLVYSPHAGCCGELGGEGLPLGVKGNWKYKDYTAYAKPGEIFILSTDGVWEVRNNKGEKFGKNRVKEIISQNGNLGAESIHKSIIETVETFRGEASQEDDITVMVIKFL